MPVKTWQKFFVGGFMNMDFAIVGWILILGTAMVWMIGEVGGLKQKVMGLEHENTIMGSELRSLKGVKTENDKKV
jgi:hypothetical protein